MEIINWFVALLIFLLILFLGFFIEMYLIIIYKYYKTKETNIFIKKIWYIAIPALYTVVLIEMVKLKFKKIITKRK